MRESLLSKYYRVEICHMEMIEFNQAKYILNTQRFIVSLVLTQWS